MTEATTTRDEKMNTLCKTCPTCGSNNTRKFAHKHSFMPYNTMPHYFCHNCRTLWGIGRPPAKKTYGK